MLNELGNLINRTPKNCN